MFNAENIPDNVLLVGGTSEIGLAIAKELAGRGSTHFLLAARSAQEVSRAADVISTAAPGEAATCHTVDYDTLEAGSARAMLEVAEVKLDTIDLVIVAVGDLGRQRADETDPDAVRRLLQVNFANLAADMVAIANVMRAQGFGRILVLSSVAALRPRRANFIYGAAKAGLDGFSLALADALAPSGIVVTVVRPGFVVSKMTAHLVRRPLSTTPDAVARVAVTAMVRGRRVAWRVICDRFGNLAGEVLGKSLLILTVKIHQKFRGVKSCLGHASRLLGAQIKGIVELEDIGASRLGHHH